MSENFAVAKFGHLRVIEYASNLDQLAIGHTLA
jgi:hypothetical protein